MCPYHGTRRPTFPGHCPQRLWPTHSCVSLLWPAICCASLMDHSYHLFSWIADQRSQFLGLRLSNLCPGLFSHCCVLLAPLVVPILNIYFCLPAYNGFPDNYYLLSVCLSLISLVQMAFKHISGFLFFSCEKTLNKNKLYSSHLQFETLRINDLLRSNCYFPVRKIVLHSDTVCIRTSQLWIFQQSLMFNNKIL